MDEREIVKEILSADPDITVVVEDDGIFYFELFGLEYGILYYSIQERTKFPNIFVKNYDKYDYPHIMTYEVTINDAICRCICLYEDEKFVTYLYSYEEKVRETIERLKVLLQLTEKEIEEEFQKEFLYYWTQESIAEINVYLNKQRCFQKLNLYQNIQGEKSERFVSSGIKLNDAKEYKHIPNIEGFYIPITDNRQILPPVKGKTWTIKEIMNVINGKPYSRISRDTFDKISAEKSKAEYVLLIFEMIIAEQSFHFGVRVEFCNQVKDSLMNKLKNSVKKIELYVVNRCDYYFLNKQIGNDNSLIGKKVAIVGCGSLGSYIIEDLVKAGIKNIALYDDDIVAYANVLRHKADFYWKGYHKVTCMKYKIETIHPEVLVEIKGNITDDVLRRDMQEYDLIIFTVGNSNVQLSSNKVFTEVKYNKPVMYVWLEAGGIDSHILIVDYSKKGCFECLFTGKSGMLVNNKANRLSEEIVDRYTLRNGCGATRVAYGTSILLKTTSVVLDTIQKIFSGVINENSLINITATEIVNNENSFAEGECRCCGNRNKAEVY